MNKDELQEVLKKIKKVTGVDLTNQVEKVVIARAEDFEDLSPEKIKELSKLAGDPSQEDLDLFNDFLDDGTANSNDMCFTYVQECSVDDWDFRTTIPDLILSACSPSACLKYYATTETLVYKPDLKLDSGIEIAYRLTDDFTRSDCVTGLSIICGHIKYLMETYNYLMPPLDLCEEFVDKIMEFKSDLNSYVSKYKK